MADLTIFDLLMGGAGEPHLPEPRPAVTEPPDDRPLPAEAIDAAVAMLRTAGPLLPATEIPAAPRGGRVWVYDTEVFPNLVLHVFTDGTRTEVFHHGCWERLRAFLADPRVVLAGFNNADFDDPILRFLLRTPTATVADVVRLCATIIAERAPSDLRWGAAPWSFSIDVFQLLNGRGSLKEWECKLGLDVVAESPHPFDRPLLPQRRGGDRRPAAAQLGSGADARGAAGHLRPVGHHLFQR